MFGKISEYPIGEDYTILYNDKSNEEKNKFLLNFVQYTDICEPIIFISNNSIKINKIKSILKENHNQYMYILS